MELCEWTKKFQLRAELFQFVLVTSVQKHELNAHNAPSH